MQSPVRNLRPSVALVGCGKMGSALLRGWIETNVASDIHVLDPSGLPDDFADEDTVTGYATPAELAAIIHDVDAIVLAVKPQIMAQICPLLARIVKPHTIILSVAAGQATQRFEEYFTANHPIIRSMPNTPAAIGRGMTVAVSNAATRKEQRQIADALLRAVGHVEWVEDETLMDAVTALSGSGPAYLFHLIETMAAAGANAGLDPNFAMRLARQTVVGAAALAIAEPRQSAETLRKNVTSPAGTTAAAMEVLLKDNRMQSMMDDAIAAGKARSIELAKA